MDDPARQVRDWLDTYNSPNACLAHLLCDRHPAGDVAVTEVAADVSHRELTYGELGERSRRLAAGLANLGVQPGDRVATIMNTGHDLITTMLAIWRLGAVYVPLFTALAPSAITYRLHHSATTIVICDPEYREKITAEATTAAMVVNTSTVDETGDLTVQQLQQSPAATAPPVAVGGHAPFILLYTPGPAGTPRAIPVPVRALAAFHSYLVYGLDVNRSDVYWNTTDPGWSYGLYFGVVAPLLAGVQTLQLRAGFDAELTLDVLATLQVSNLAAEPTLYRALRASVKSLPPQIQPRRLSSAGEPLTPELADWATDVFGVAIRDHYGQAELGICAGEPNHPQVAVTVTPGSAGVALPGWRIGVIEPGSQTQAPVQELGQIAVDLTHSPVAWFHGYAAAEDTALYTAERFSDDGRWYLTGDTGRCDATGQVFLAARDPDLIISAGYRISPFEVESLLLAHPAVVEAAVYGTPDEIAGQLISMQVVLQDGYTDEAKLTDELRDVVRRGLGEHAHPHAVNIVTQLPRSASGKIQRAQIRRG